MKYAAFVRAINLGQKNKVAKQELQDVFVKAGSQNVSTYLQSGNVLFESERIKVDPIKKFVENSLKELLDTPIPVMVRKVIDLRKIMKNTPYPQEKPDSDQVWYVSFLDKEVVLPFSIPYEVEGKDLVFIEQRGLDLFSIATKIKGHTTSPNALLERSCKIYSTTRNWNTIKRLLERA